MKMLQLGEEKNGDCMKMLSKETAELCKSIGLGKDINKSKVDGGDVISIGSSLFKADYFHEGYIDEFGKLRFRKVAVSKKKEVA
jgi:hypothetical protein